MRNYDKILGGLMGVACGDALGCTLEFRLPPKKQLKNIVGGGVLNWKQGEVTDDTDMTLCVARGILKQPNDPISEIGKEFIKWFDTNPKDIGNTCRLSISNFKRYNDWKKASDTTNTYMSDKTAGNGTLMRCIPIGLYYTNLDTIIDLSIQQSELTHLNYEASYFCCLYNEIIYRMMKNWDKNKLKKQFKDILGFENIDKDKELLIPDGYVKNSFICALWCFLNTNSSEQAIIQAVNLGGDSDTIGAITGGLAGVYYGYSSLPKRWTNKILIKDEIINIANKFSKQD